MSFQYNDIIIKLDKQPGELNKVYFDKGFNIAKDEPKNASDFNKLLNEYNLKANKRYLNVKY